MNPWAPFEWITALRFLREGRLQTLFILVAVSIGVAVIVFMSAMLASLQANFLKRVLTSQPHIQLIPPDEIARPLRKKEPGQVVASIVQRPAQRIRSIDQWQKIRTALSQWPEITNVTPTMQTSALAVRGDASRSITLNGIDPEAYFRIVRIPDYIIAGQPRLLTDDILVGTELAKDLGASLGDKIIARGGTGATRTLTITGILDFGNKGANQRNTYVALRTAQALANLVGGVTTIDITVDDIYAADRIANAIEAATGVEADSWIKTNAQFFTAVQAQQNSNTLIRAFVGLSVAFGIASVLVVSVIQRSKDIGILRAMGTSRAQILRVFLIQGGLLGLLGSIFGTAAGGSALVLWHAIIRQADGSELFPLLLEPSLFISAVLIAAVTGVAAAAVPALRAAMLDPVVAIRG
jgi:lipoprotein-releasing system permease protein